MGLLEGRSTGLWAVLMLMFQPGFILGQALDTSPSNELVPVSFDQANLFYFQSFLEAGRDELQQMISFDWGVHFFRNRGGNSSDSDLFLQGLRLRSSIDGQIPWSDLAGLNTPLRNRWQRMPTQRQEYALENRLGVQHIDISPFRNRLQNHLVFSVANRFYSTRFGYSTTREFGKKPHRFSLSYTGRIGFFNHLRSSSFWLSWAYRPERSSEWGAVLFGVRSTRSRQGALTREIWELLGPDFRSDQGNWKGRSRPTRLVEAFRPLLLFYRNSHTEAAEWNSSVALQIGRGRQTRLSYQDAPHPNPVYYRYLPSFYRRRAFGHRTDLAQIEQDLIRNPDLSWQQLVEINRGSSSGQAFYSVLGDQEKRRRIWFSSHVKAKPSPRSTWYTGIAFLGERYKYSQHLLDLLGAQWWKNVDPFTHQAYNVEGPMEKIQGEPVGYAYNFYSQSFRLDASYRHQAGPLEIQGGVKYQYLNRRRTGLYANDWYGLLAKGPSANLKQQMLGARLWGQWDANLRYQFRGSIQWEQTFLPLSSLLIEPELSNSIHQPLPTPWALSVNLEAKTRQEDWELRITGFYNKLAEQQSRRNYYSETVHSQSFISEVLANQSQLHLGFEGLFVWQPLPSNSFEFGWQLRKDVWQNNPRLHWYFRPEPNDVNQNTEPVSINQTVSLKGKALAKGPQSALGMRWNYRSEKYWWLQLGLHCLWNNRLALAPVRYTNSFLLSPRGTEPIPLSPNELWAYRLQEKLPAAAYMHLSWGKSWKNKERYTRLFISFQNLTNSRTPTGGFQQGRVGHVSMAREEFVSGYPLFGNRYWMNSGRTFFLNLSHFF